MSNLKYAQFLYLRDTLKRPPIDLPAEIYFGGNETLQRTPGRHHMPEFQETGTYWHPNLCAQRLRVAEDRLKRAENMTASEAELKKSGNMADMRNAVSARKKELQDVLSGKNPEANKLFEPEPEVEAEEEEKAVEEPKQAKAKVAPKAKGKVEAEPEDRAEPSIVQRAMAAAKSRPQEDFASDKDED